MEPPCGAPQDAGTSYLSSPRHRMVRGDNMQNETDSSRALLDNLMNRLSEADKKKLKSILSDKAACEKLLKSPEAQSLMRQFEGKRNG